MVSRRDGFSFVDWVRHPFRTARAVHNGRGPTIPEGDVRLEPRSRRFSEKLLEADALRRASREIRAYARPFGFYVWRVARRCRLGTARLDRARAALNDQWPLGVRFSRRGRPRRRGARGDVLTTSAAEVELRRLTGHVERDRAEGSNDHEPARGSILGAYAILGVDFVGLFMVFSLLLNVAVVPGVTPDWRRLVTALAFSVFGVGTLAIAAHQLGDRAWRRRHELRLRAPDGERPRTAAMVALGIAVVAVSAAAAASIAIRVVAEGAKIATPGWLLTPVAVLVGVAALVAPWLVVGHRASDGSWETFRIMLLRRAVAQRRMTYRNMVERATADRDAARQVRNRARRVYEIVMLECDGFYDDAHREIIAGRHGACTEGLCPSSPAAAGGSPGSVLPVQTPMNPGCLLVAIEQMDADLARLELQLTGPERPLRGDDFSLVA